MNTLTSLAALVAIALIATVAESARSGEITANELAAPTEQMPMPARPVMPGRYVQTWPQPPHWRGPQHLIDRLLPPPKAWVNPLNAVLQQTQEQLSTKSSELIEAHGMLEQLRGSLQDCLASEAKLSDKVTYCTREQHALRVRVTDLIKTLNTANATLEQQHQLINDLQAQHQTLMAEHDQLRSEFANRNKQLTVLQSELQAAMQTLTQAMARASATRTRVNKLEGEQTVETGLQPRYGRD